MAVHSSRWLDKLRSLVDTEAPTIIEEDSHSDEVTYITKTTFQDALQVRSMHWPSSQAIAQRQDVTDPVVLRARLQVLPLPALMQ